MNRSISGILGLYKSRFKCPGDAEYHNKRRWGIYNCLWLN